MKSVSVISDKEVPEFQLKETVVDVSTKLFIGFTCIGFVGGVMSIKTVLFVETYH